jgi:hypothetical protein
MTIRDNQVDGNVSYGVVNEPSEIDRLREKVAELHAYVERYGQHFMSCGVWCKHGPEGTGVNACPLEHPCTCGLRAILQPIG